jgi:nucleoside-diphosphate-sugar epimerase
MKSPTTILVIGARGQIGTDLTAALRKHYGNHRVIAADLHLHGNIAPEDEGPAVTLNVLNKLELGKLVDQYKVTHIYLLAALLSATGEQNPEFAWHLNMQGLFNVLELAREKHLQQVFWPSSIAVFGPESPKQQCPQFSDRSPRTVYGISKLAGEGWCQYYHEKFGVDVRSLRYPGLISHTAKPGGGTTDYAVDIFHQALQHNRYTCFLTEDTTLPMMYMPDAIYATLSLMHAPAEQVRIRTSYNIHAFDLTPEKLAVAIQQHLPAFRIQYQPDHRQQIAHSWPDTIDDQQARQDWAWKPHYAIPDMVNDMLTQLRKKPNHAFAIPS